MPSKVSQFRVQTEKNKSVTVQYLAKIWMALEHFLILSSCKHKLQCTILGFYVLTKNIVADRDETKYNHCSSLLDFNSDYIFLILGQLRLESLFLSDKCQSNNIDHLFYYFPHIHKLINTKITMPLNNLRVSRG